MKRPPQPELPEFVREVMPAAGAPLARALGELSFGSCAPPQLLRERLLRAVARPRLRYAPHFAALNELFDLCDMALADLFERAEDPQSWASAPMASTRLLHVTAGPRAAHADNGLVRLEPGAGFPLHRHLGVERVLVLEGGYREEPGGRLYLPGDVQEMPAGSSHAYTALGERALLLAVSVVEGVDVEGFGQLSPASG